MKYNWENFTERQKIKAVQEEINLVTHNGTTKDDLLNMLRWLWDKFEVEWTSKEDIEICNGCGKEYDSKTTGGIVNGHTFCQECIVGMAEESVKINIALDKACGDVADSCCPCEYDLYECDKCVECQHQGEIHEDTQRDKDCWKKYYLQEAGKL